MRDNPLIEAALENAEALVDTLTDNEVLKSIPVVGTALKVIKAAGDMRDRLFAAKLMSFLKALGSVSPELKEKIRKRVAESPDESQKVGETVVLLLDRLADLEKAQIMAKIFIAYAFGHVSAPDFQRLVHAVDQAVLYDLQEFLLKSHNIGKKGLSTETFMRSLYPAGITQIVGGKTLETVGNLYFTVSPIGKKLINAYNQGKRLSKQPDRM